MSMKKNALLNYIKGLPIVPATNDKGETIITYARRFKNSGLGMIMSEDDKEYIKEEEITEAENWLIKNNLFIATGDRAFDCLVK